MATTTTATDPKDAEFHALRDAADYIHDAYRLAPDQAKRHLSAALEVINDQSWELIQEMFWSSDEESTHRYNHIMGKQ
jgi:hypothetical protein